MREIAGTCLVNRLMHAVNLDTNRAPAHGRPAEQSYRVLAPDGLGQAARREQRLDRVEPGGVVSSRR